MGNDGGTIPKRHELVKEKKEDPKADERIQSIARWFYCALSKAKLRTPVVADQLGKLYNREAILELLLDRSSYGDADKICAHIGSMKDIVTLKLAPNPSLEERNRDTNGSSSSIAENRTTASSGAEENLPRASFICPVTLREMNGSYRFLFSWRCGCVVSEQAIKEIAETHCLVCNKPVEPTDYIPINPSPEELENLKSAMVTRKKSEKEKRLKRKKGKSRTDDDNSDDKGNSGNKTSKRPKVETSHTNREPTSRISGRVAGIIEEYRSNTSHQRGVSPAVRSMFVGAKKDENNGRDTNYLCRGTFNRYAA